MNDRIPLYPGRVKMTPVAGQANTFDMVRADDPTQAGTPLNKATFLKDATAALYGLGTGAVPDDVLAELGKYKQYWWRRRIPAGERYVEVQSDIPNAIGLFGPYVETSQVIYSKQLTIDQNNGTAALGAELTLPKTSGKELAEAIVANAPLYVSVSGTIYCIPDGATAGAGSNPSFNTSTIMYYTSSNKDYVYINGSGTPLGKTVTTEKKQIPAGDWEYLQSSTRSAYPDSGTQDGYEYEYLGVPFDNAVTAPKIETGSYVGTGTYGQANPNTLTFWFVPKLVWIYEANKNYISTSAGYNGLWFASWPYLSYLLDSGTTVTRYASLSGKTLSWYESSSAFNQLNYSNIVYTYFAIG
jgi:hypothetical protein